MKIAGTHAKGSLKGDVIELTPVEKVPVAVTVAAAVHDPDSVISVSEVQLGATKHSAKGDLYKKRFQNDSYVSEGEASFTSRRKTTDTVLEPKKKRFKVEFC